MVIFRNGRVIGVDKAFLKSLNERLDTLSYLLNLIELQIASLNQDSIELKGEKFYVKKREILSVEEDIAIFELFPVEVGGERRDRKVVPIIRGEKVPFAVKRRGEKEELSTPEKVEVSTSQEQKVDSPSISSFIGGSATATLGEKVAENMENLLSHGAEKLLEKGKEEKISQKEPTPEVSPKEEELLSGLEDLEPVISPEKEKEVEITTEEGKEKIKGASQEAEVDDLLANLDNLDLEPTPVEEPTSISPEKLEKEVEEVKEELEELDLPPLDEIAPVSTPESGKESKTPAEEKEEEKIIIDNIDQLVDNLGVEGIDLLEKGAEKAQEVKEEELVPPPIPEDAHLEIPEPEVESLKPTSSPSETETSPKSEEETLDLDDLLGDIEPEKLLEEVKEEESKEKGTKEEEIDDLSLEELLPTEETKEKKEEENLEDDLLSLLPEEKEEKIEEAPLGDSLDTLLEEEEEKEKPSKEESPKEESTPAEEKKEEAPQGEEGLLENLELVEEEEKKEEKPQGPIILQFEDDFEEVRELLREDTQRARQKVKEELQKASLELGIPEDLGADLFKDLINQIMGEKKYFKKILKVGDYEELHKTAHKLKGAALNLRLSQIALILKMIDEYSKRREPIDTIANLVDSFYQFMEKVKDVDQIIGKEETGGGFGVSSTTPSSSFSSPSGEDGGEREASVSTPKPKLTRIIIKTIRKYLEKGDEKAFQRDKKHIEKLLNTKLNSLDDLRKFIGE